MPYSFLMPLTAPARLVALLIALCLSRPVRAQPQPLWEPEAPEKSPAVAFGLSLLGTGAGVFALLAASHVDHGEYFGAAGIATLVVGPSLGHFYAGEGSRGARHAALRLGAVAVMGAGLLVALSSPCAFGPENHDDCPNARDGFGLGILAAGAVLGAGSAVYSVFDAPNAAERTNRRASSLTLLPAPIIGPDHTAGLSLSGSF